MESILVWILSHTGIIASLVTMIVDAIISLHPGTPADGILELVKNFLVKLLGGSQGGLPPLNQTNEL